MFNKARKYLIISFLLTTVLILSASSIIAATRISNTIKVSKTTITKGASVIINGQIYPKKRRIRVYVYQKKYNEKHYHRIKVLRTNSKGKYSYNIKPTVTARYKTYFNYKNKRRYSKSKLITVKKLVVPTPTPTPSPTPTPTPAQPPVLKNLGVDFAPYNAETDRAGAFPFIFQQDKPFFEFGDQGTEPTFTYMIDETADVFAVANGYVRAVNYQPAIDDYSILVSTDSQDHTWTIDYDHLVNPQVTAGMTITAGTLLGKPEPMGLGIGRVEIQVFGPNAQGQLTSFCPFNYFDPNLIDTYKAKLTQLMDDYNAFNLLTDYYFMDNYATSGHVGCLTSSMAEQ